MTRLFKDAKVVRRYIESDVALVKKNSRYLIFIDNEGLPYKMEERYLLKNSNEIARLNVISVIGSAVVFGVYYPEVVLFEIGLGRARPYHEAFLPKEFLEEDCKKRRLCKRKRYASISDDQIKNLWPFLEDILVARTRDKIKRWRTRDGFNFSSNHLFINKKGYNGYILKDKSYKRGVCFSVSFDDACLLASILKARFRWAEDFLIKFSNLINLSLSLCGQYYYTDNQLKAWRPKGVFSLVDVLKRDINYRILPFYYDLLTGSFISDKYLRLFEFVVDKFNLLNMRVYNQVKSTLENKNTFDLFLSDAVLIVPEIKKERDFLVFELIPGELL